LQQGGAFASRTLAPVLSIAVRIGKQFRLVRLKLFPGDVSRMHIGQEHRPFFSLQASVAKLSAKDNFALAGSAIDEGSGVARIVQNA